MTDVQLPEGWIWKKLGEVSINFDGKRIPISKEIRAKRKGEYRYFGATEIVDYIDSYIFEGKFILIGEDGANLLSKSKPLSFIVTGKFWVNNHAHIIQTHDSLNADFFNYYFNSLTLHDYVSGSAQPKLTQNNLNKIPIPLPPLPVQRQIVARIEELFSELDAGVSELQTALTRLKTYRRAVLHHYLNNPDWERVKLGEVITCLDHKRKPISSKIREAQQGTIPYYGANGQTGWIDNFLFDEDLILVVEDETFTGREKPFSYKVTGKSWVNNHAHILKPKSVNLLNIDFLNYSLWYYPFLPLLICE